MNSKQRRYQRRKVQPFVMKLIEGHEAAADMMERDGSTMTPKQCRDLAQGLRDLLAGSTSWADKVRA